MMKVGLYTLRWADVVELFRLLFAFKEAEVCVLFASFSCCWLWLSAFAEFCSVYSICCWLF